MTGPPVVRTIAMLGFGEAGSILAADLVRGGVTVSMYDILLDAPQTRAAMRAKAVAAGVMVADSLADVLRGAELAICAVTAASAEEVAGKAAVSMPAGQFYLDINSVSPSAKQASAARVAAGGGYYVEAAVMAPVPPQRLGVPMLLGGARAESLAAALRPLGMNVTPIATEIGVASAVKMCRSIVIKGLEALAVECLFAARQFGAERQVLTSLERTYPHMGWTAGLPDYLVSRMAEHGRRRAAEMREVVRTLQDVGMTPIMAAAIAERHDGLIDAMNDRQLAYVREPAFSWRALADALAATQEPEG